MPRAISKTIPIADKDYPCAWTTLKPPHTIPKGERYVRVVHKEDNGFESDHICLDCWITWSKLYEPISTREGPDESNT